MKQKTEIVFEIEEFVTVKNRRSYVDFCRECKSWTVMVTVETAAKGLVVF